MIHSLGTPLQHHDRYKKLNYTQLCNSLDTIMTVSQEQSQAFYFWHVCDVDILCAALYPIDTIKTRLQLMLKGGGWKALVKQGGAKNLYAGVWGNLVGVAPASAVFMGIYEPVKAAISSRVSEERSFLGPLGAGSAAGVVASVIRVPTEVVKQRLQSGQETFNMTIYACRTLKCSTIVFRYYTSQSAQHG